MLNGEHGEYSIHHSTFSFLNVECCLRECCSLVRPAPHSRARVFARANFGQHRLWRIRGVRHPPRSDLSQWRSLPPKSASPPAVAMSDVAVAHVPANWCPPPAAGYVRASREVFMYLELIPHWGVPAAPPAATHLQRASAARRLHAVTRRRLFGGGARALCFRCL